MSGGCPAALGTGFAGMKTPMNDEMIESVARAAQLTPEQARLAVAAMLRFLTARLPSAMVGELHARLDLPALGETTVRRRRADSR